MLLDSCLGDFLNISLDLEGNHLWGRQLYTHSDSIEFPSRWYCAQAVNHVAIIHLELLETVSTATVDPYFVPDKQLRINSHS